MMTTFRHQAPEGYPRPMNAKFQPSLPPTRSLGSIAAQCAPAARFACGCLSLVFSLGVALLSSAQEDGDLAPIPEDLLEDAHIREEFGVNGFTAPSIEKIFADLDKLGDLSYDQLKREIPTEPPQDRAQLALALGTLISDGFLIVQTEKYSELTDIGRALTRHAKMLGAGTRLSSHSKSLIENSALGRWDKLKNELAKTQRDVEAEMVLLRDVDAAHLISLGGWLRAFEIATTAALQPFDAEKARVLGRADIAEYFLMSMQTLEPALRETEYIQALTAGIEQLHDLLDVPAGKDFTQPEVEKLRTTALELVTLTIGGKKKTEPAKPAAPTGGAVPKTAER